MLQLQLVTLAGTKLDESVYEIQLPTTSGIIGVFPGHSALVSVAKAGIVTVRRKAGDSDIQQERYAINGGVIEIGDDVVRVLVDEADHEDEINEAEAQRALERAQALKKDAKDQISLDQAQALIDRQAVRLHLAGLRRHKRR